MQGRQHKTASATCGRGRKESGQSSRCTGTQAQGWRTLVAPLLGAPGHPCRVVKAARPRQHVDEVARIRDRAVDAQEHKHRAGEPSWPLCVGPRAPMQGSQGSAAPAPSGPGLEVPGERKKVARTRPRRRGARGERFAGAAGPLGGAPRGTQHIYILGRRAGWDPRAAMRTQKCRVCSRRPQSAGSRVRAHSPAAAAVAPCRVREDAGYPGQAARGQCRGRSTLQGDLKKKISRAPPARGR